MPGSAELRMFLYRCTPLLLGLAGCSERQLAPENHAPAPHLSFGASVYTASEADSAVALDLHRFPHGDTLQASVVVLDGTARPQVDYHDLPQVVRLVRGIPSRHVGYERGH
jgi:hypothetical protein